MTREYTKNETIINGLLDSLAVAGESAAKTSMLKRIEELTEANREIGDQLRELEGQTAENLLRNEAFDLLRRQLSDFRTNAGIMSTEEKRSAVRTLVSKIIWDGTSAHMVLIGADWENPW